MRQPQFRQPSLILPGKQLEISKTGLLTDYFPAKQYDLGLAGQQLIDFSGNGNHGTHGNTIDSDNGDPTQESNCLFYNFDDYTQLPLNIFNPLEGTFEIIFNAVDSYGGLRILGSDSSAGSNSELRTFITSANSFGLFLANGSTTASVYVRIFLGIPQVYTCTWKYNGNVTVISSFINGKYGKSITLLGQVVAPNTSLMFGRWPASNYSKFRLYRGLFYSRQLNIPEVQINYQLHKKELEKKGVVL